MGGPKDFGQTGLVLQDPVCRGQGPRGFIEAFARDILLPDDDDHAGEQTLEDIEDIANRSVVAERGECRAVKDHLPLNSTLGRKERGGVDWNLDAHGGGPRKAIGGLERAGALDGEEHARVSGDEVVPTVFPDEVGLEPEQPPVGTGVGGTEGVCGGERDAGPGCPVVHSLYGAGERDDGERGVGHWREGDGGGWEGARRGEGRGSGKGRVLKG